MRFFDQNPENFADPDYDPVSSLVYGWGNEAWSAQEEYLSACVRHALETDGPILECGSGLSTILVGEIARRRGIEYWVLEHSAHWAKKTRNYLDRQGNNIVRLWQRPLVDYGAFSWYAPPFERMPSGFALVICDGPPGSTHGGRVGLISVMREHLRSGSIILLDDGDRAEEQAIVDDWRHEMKLGTEVLGESKSYFKLEVLESSIQLSESA